MKKLGKHNVILIGRINKDGVPIGGETSKNQSLIKALSGFVTLVCLDYYQNKKHPWVYLQTLFALICYPKASIILSTTASNIYPLLKAFRFLKIKRNIIHWIVGGEFDKLVDEGKFDIETLNVATFHLAQSHVMVENLEKSGLHNVMYVPNFREIFYIPDLVKSMLTRKKSDVVRFVFLSRIKETKGVGIILECIQILNAKGLSNKFEVDFYGRMDEGYNDRFNKYLKTLSNAKYKGVLDLRLDTGYDILAGYHAMLFPTFHPSEGVAGVLVDAQIAGVPVIASDWGHNREIIADNENGIIVPAHDKDALCCVMELVINGKIDLDRLAECAQSRVEYYNTDNVVTKKFLENLNVI